MYSWIIFINEETSKFFIISKTFKECETSCFCCWVTHCVWLFCDPMDPSLPGISQGKILEWVAIFLFKGIFPTKGSNLCLLFLLPLDGFFYSWNIGEALWNLTHIIKSTVNFSNQFISQIFTQLIYFLLENLNLHVH